MIARVPVSSEMRDRATALGLNQPQLRHSIKSGHGAILGYLGELVVLQLHGGWRIDTYDYDVVVLGGHTVEVKTKETTVEPQPHYDCSVAAANTRQRCDYYGFVRVAANLEEAWWCGAISREDFYRRARFVHAGQQDGDNGWVAQADCWNLPISELGDIPGPVSTGQTAFTLKS